MARDGKMEFKAIGVAADAEILNRSEFEGVALTLDFAGVTTKDANDNIRIPAGTPIDKDGKAVTATPWAGAIGLLLHDVYPARPQGTVLKKAYINVTRAQAHNALTYDAALVAEVAKTGGRIVLEDPITA